MTKKRKNVTLTACIPVTALQKKPNTERKILPHLLVVLLLWALYRMRANLTVTFSTRWSNGDTTNGLLLYYLQATLAGFFAPVKR